MKADLNEITINGKVYVERGSVKEIELKDYVIIRTHSAGVFAGYLESRHGKQVELANARRLWSWDGAASLSELSQQGVSKPDDCKFPQEVPRVILTEAIEILPCSEKARKSIAEVTIWTAH